MRADHAQRHNAAVGAVFGLAVGDAMRNQSPLPPVVSCETSQCATWGPVGDAAFSTAEDLLRGGLLDIGLGPSEVVAAAVGLADPGASPQLLADSDAVLVCSIVRSGMHGDLELQPDDAASSDVHQSIEAVAGAASFAEALRCSTAAARPLAGALAGLRWGPAAIPAAWLTPVRGPVGSRTYGMRQLRRLAERLMGLDAPVPPEPRRSLGPVEVAPQLWLSNLHAVPRFVARHPDGAVISLCPSTGAFDAHPHRREFHIHDAAGRSVNPRLASTVDEVLATIRAFHDQQRDVLVHCHHGASRTGLVLRAWLVEELGLSADDATTEAQVRWSKTSTWNRAFGAEIERRAHSTPDTAADPAKNAGYAG